MTITMLALPACQASTSRVTHERKRTPTSTLSRRPIRSASQPPTGRASVAPMVTIAACNRGILPVQREPIAEQLGQVVRKEDEAAEGHEVKQAEMPGRSASRAIAAKLARPAAPAGRRPARRGRRARRRSP